MSAVIRARSGGVDHKIPDIWVAGWCSGMRTRGYDVSPSDAIAQWINQADLEGQWEQENPTP